MFFSSFNTGSLLGRIRLYALKSEHIRLVFVEDRRCSANHKNCVVVISWNNLIISYIAHFYFEILSGLVCATMVSNKSLSDLAGYVSICLLACEF